MEIKSQSRELDIQWLKCKFEQYLKRLEVYFMLQESKGIHWDSQKKIQHFISGIDFDKMVISESEAIEVLNSVLMK